MFNSDAIASKTFLLISAAIGDRNREDTGCKSHCLLSDLKPQAGLPLGEEYTGIKLEGCLRLFDVPAPPLLRPRLTPQGEALLAPLAAKLLPAAFVVLTVIYGLLAVFLIMVCSTVNE